MNNEVNIEAVIGEILAKTGTATRRMNEKITHAAAVDTQQFLGEVKADLATYSNQLANKEITQDEFEYNVKSLVDLAVLHNLKDQLLNQVEIDRFKATLVTLMVDVVSAAVGIKQRAQV